MDSKLPEHQKMILNEHFPGLTVEPWYTCWPESPIFQRVPDCIPTSITYDRIRSNPHPNVYEIVATRTMRKNTRTSIQVERVP